MIRYSLKCAEAHKFDSWFASAEAFDALQKARHLECPACGSSDVRKAMMAPPVSGKETVATDTADAGRGPLQRNSAAERLFGKLRQHVENNSDYVGTGFAAEARRMHLGEVPQRAIHGEAKAEDAKALIEEGISVLPLPFRIGTKSN